MSTAPAYYEDEKPALEAKEQQDCVEDVDSPKKVDVEDGISRSNLGNVTGIATAMYAEALEKYGKEGSIDPAVEKKLVRYAFNGVGVGLGGLIGFAIGHIKGSLQSWRYEFLIVGAVCAAWGISLAFTIGNSPTTNRWFTHDERLMIIARLRRNQTGVEGRKIRWDQIREAFLDYKTWIFFSLGMIGNGGISNFSTLVIKGLGFTTLQTALMALPQGAIVVCFIAAGALLNDRLPKNSRTIVCMLFMIPTIAGGLGFLLAPEKAYVARLICFYLTGSYQASFVLGLSLITSNTGGQSKKMIVSGMIWFGACIGNIISPFFYLTSQAPRYQLGIGSLLVANCLEFCIFLILRFAFIYENKKKEKAAAEMGYTDENSTAFSDLTDKENPK
ncbi:hypothetical protein QFC22_004836 [Naganishia vaughanmartiniae]|uniref:Uncharacterized protein n=1 Tax=Naganishia vaughanmartiniae TaxID=1424756 RepID=A0ACC2WXE6_9TREE|nr:hypothetical protein QFC22_004836 [Naganishia vaughanmartiniae]